MAISVFDLFKVGIGPSSSHTVGPMVAAHDFAHGLVDGGMLDAVARVKTDLLGSLGATGKGHGSDKAILLGLEGDTPADVKVENIESRLADIRSSKQFNLAGLKLIAFDEPRDLIMHKRKSLPYHPNAMLFTAFDSDNAVLITRTFYSVGGGFVLDEEAAANENQIKADDTPLKYPFSTGDRLLEICKEHKKSIAEIMMANELTWRTKKEVNQGLLSLWQTMQD